MSEEPEQRARQESVVNNYTPLRRRPRRRRSVYSRPINKRLLLLILLLVAMLMGAGAAYEHYHLAHYAIVINGTPLVALATKADATAAIARVQAKYAPNAPDVIVFKEGDPTIASINPSMSASSTKTAAEILDSHLTVEVQGYAIFVNRIPYVLLDSKENAARAVSLMLQIGMGNKKGIPTIKQRLTIDLMHLDKEKIGTIPIMTAEQAAAELVHPPRKQIYIVKSGDSFWSIANAHGILIADLDALNPGQSHLLHDGDQLHLPDQPAPVTIVVRDIK